jgi:hypothetical protein
MHCIFHSKFTQPSHDVLTKAVDDHNALLFMLFVPGAVFPNAVLKGQETTKTLIFWVKGTGSLIRGTVFFLLK